MSDQGALLQSAISEYGFMVNATAKHSEMKHDPAHLAHALCAHHDWTDRGAEKLVSLVNKYGAFMLRNALALAVVLDKEDGSLDF